MTDAAMDRSYAGLFRLPALKRLLPGVLLDRAGRTRPVIFDYFTSGLCTEIPWYRGSTAHERRPT